MLYENMFGQVNVLAKSLNATLLRQETINNNMANNDTPGYKKQTVQFESLLQNELDRTKNRAQDINLDYIKANVVLENPGYSMRLDENNVDIEVEMAEKSKNSLRYSTLVESTTNNFERINLVLNTLK